MWGDQRPSSQYASRIWEKEPSNDCQASHTRPWVSEASRGWYRGRGCVSPGKACSNARQRGPMRRGPSSAAAPGPTRRSGCPGRCCERQLVDLPLARGRAPRDPTGHPPAAPGRSDPRGHRTRSTRTRFPRVRSMPGQGCRSLALRRGAGALAAARPQPAHPVGVIRSSFTKSARGKVCVCGPSVTCTAAVRGADRVTSRERGPAAPESHCQDQSAPTASPARRPQPSSRRILPSETETRPCVPIPLSARHAIRSVDLWRFQRCCPARGHQQRERCPNEESRHLHSLPRILFPNCKGGAKRAVVGAGAGLAPPVGGRAPGYRRESADGGGTRSTDRLSFPGML